MSKSGVSRLLPELRGALRLDSAGSVVGPDAELEKSAFDDDAAATANKPPFSPTGAPNYYQKLTNLFPAEALAIYGSGVAIFGSANAAVVGVGLVILLMLRTVANQQRTGPAIDWRAVAVAVASYLLWATANDPNWLIGLNSHLANIGRPLRQYAAFLGAALVLMAPMVAPTPDVKAA